MTKFIQLTEFGIIARADDLFTVVPVATVSSSAEVVRDLSTQLMVSESTNIDIAVRFEISENLYNTLAMSGFEELLTVVDPNEIDEEDLETEEDEEEVEEEVEEEKPRGRGRGRKAPEPEPEIEDADVEEELPVQYFLTSNSIASFKFPVLLPIQETEGYQSLAAQSEQNEAVLEKRIGRLIDLIGEYAATGNVNIQDDDDSDGLSLTSAPASIATQAAFHQSQVQMAQARSEEIRDKIAKAYDWFQNNTQPDSEDETVSIARVMSIVDEKGTKENYDSIATTIQDAISTSVYFH